MANSKVCEARIDYTIEQWPKSKGVDEAWWLTRSVYDAKGRRISQEKIALFNFDSEAVNFAGWFREFRLAAGLDPRVSLEHSLNGLAERG